jgi:hypothetical protein
MNLGAIDLKKAFDKVYLFGVLCMMQDEGIDITIINIFENWFAKMLRLLNGTE